MYQAVFLDGERFNTDRQEYLKKHNIIYHAPAYEGYNGFPIGNGHFGGMLYHTADSLQMTLAHTDAIDFGADGNFAAWSWDSEENNTAHAACGVLSVTDEMPSFDPLYLDEYEGALELGNGVGRLHSKTPFSSWNGEVYCNRTADLLVCRFEVKNTEQVQKRVHLSRWGSRNFFHYYEQMSTDTGKNLGGMTAGINQGCFYLSQELRGCRTLTAGIVVGCEHQVDVRNSHRIEVTIPKETEAFTILVRCMVLNDQEEITEKLHQFCQDVDQISTELLKQQQIEEWKLFWEKSFLYLPQEDYIENIYYNYLYLLNSCSRGKYPVTFGSIWCPEADIRNWGHYYHWNHQQIYWGLHTGGHEELAANYYDYRFGMLPQAKADAKRIYHSEGAWYSDISNYNGYQALEPDTVRNLTCGAQIAMDFYRHWQYTGDQKFLAEQAFPVMDSAARLYEDLLYKDQGVYQIKGGSTCYESYWNLKMTATDQAMIRALFAALADCGQWISQDPERLQLRAAILGALYEVPVCETDGKQCLSPGIKWDQTPVQFLEGKYPYNAFSLCQLCAVFPAGIIGLKDQGTDVFTYARNAMAEALQKDIYPQAGYTSGHSAAPQTAARLGMKQDTLKLIRLFIEKYQCFYNGTCHFTDLPDEQADLSVRQISKKATAWTQLHEKEYGERVTLKADRFVHNYFEAHANIYTGINEMLLQSHDGIIRVFPAAEEGLEAAFDLRAVGGFRVRSESKAAQVKYIQIESLLGNPCRLFLPWKDSVRVKMDGAEVDCQRIDDLLVFPTIRGGNYLIENCQYPLDGFYQDRIDAAENLAPKYYGKRMIGKERCF